MIDSITDWIKIFRSFEKPFQAAARRWNKWVEPCAYLVTARVQGKTPLALDAYAEHQTWEYWRTRSQDFRPALLPGAHNRRMIARNTAKGERLVAYTCGLRDACEAFGELATRAGAFLLFNLDDRQPHLRHCSASDFWLNFVISGIPRLPGPPVQQLVPPTGSENLHLVTTDLFSISLWIIRDVVGILQRAA